MRFLQSLLATAVASVLVTTPRLSGQTGCDQIKEQMEQRRTLQDQLQKLQAAKLLWVEYALEAELGEVPEALRTPQSVQEACRRAAEGLDSWYAISGTSECVKRFIPPPRDRVRTLKDIKEVHMDLAKSATNVQEKLDRTLTPMADLQKRWNALDCDGSNTWKKLIGRWRNGKGTLVLDFVNTSRGIEGRVVKPQPDWPPNIVAGTVFFRSSVVAGETAAGRMKSGQLEGSFRNFPQGKDCPGLAREAKYDSGTIEIGSETITLHQNGRYYKSSSCEWAEKTFTTDTSMSRAQ